jgi:hypothetical protein
MGVNTTAAEVGMIIGVLRSKDLGKWDDNVWVAV